VAQAQFEPAAAGAAGEQPLPLEVVGQGGDADGTELG